MIKYACNPPKVNAEAIINRGLPSLGIAPAQSPIPGFGVAIDNKLAEIPGRELPPPGLSYKVGQARPRDGSWNILDVKFHRAATISSWWVLVVKDGRDMIQGPQDQNLVGLIEGFSTKLRKSGIAVPSGRPNLLPPANLPKPHTDPERTNALNTIRQVLRTALSMYKTKPSFVLVLLENRDNYIYPGIKVAVTHFVDVMPTDYYDEQRIGDVELGINTIHMQLEKAFGPPNKQDQYFSNVALKVNTKLGGMNHLVRGSLLVKISP